jgi:hypothetical protein
MTTDDSSALEQAALDDLERSAAEVRLTAAQAAAARDVVVFRLATLEFAPLMRNLRGFVEEDWSEDGYAHGVDFELAATPAQLLEFSTWLDSSHTGVWCRFTAIEPS